METKNTTPQNERVVKLQNATQLKRIFERHLTFGDSDSVIEEKAQAFSEAEGKIDSITPEPKMGTTFSIRINDVVTVLPYEAIDLDEFEERFSEE